MITIKKENEKFIFSKDGQILGEVAPCKNGYSFSIKDSNLLTNVQGKKPFTKEEATNQLLKYLAL
jgi:hypothetical protein